MKGQSESREKKNVETNNFENKKCKKFCLHWGKNILHIGSAKVSL